MKKLPGIFNDVIGPVMRGPSSSHTAASWRIARIALDILNDPLEKALIEFDRDGAWAPNYREQGTTMGIDGGLLGLEITDERMKFAERYAREEGINIEYKISSFPTDHANTVRLTLWGTSQKRVQIVAVSLGGGSFEIRSVEGFPVFLNGDLFGIITFASNNPHFSNNLKSITPPEVEFLTEQKEGITKVEFKSSYPFSTEFIAQLQNHPHVGEIAIINPIMPVVSGRQTEMPFSTLESSINYAEEKGLDLGDLGLVYERCTSGLTEQELVHKMEEMIQIIHKSIDTGLNGTEYADRILQQQSHLVGNAVKDGKIADSVITRIIANVSALMESKSAMEVVVAVPTAGSCGTVGGSLRAVAENIGSAKEELVKAYYAAGLVGAYFAQGPGFSAEEHGCQVECGAASGMAAAAMVQLMGGTARQAVGAASMAIQNMIGLVCDPVADRVEVPCLGKNISAAVNAYSSAIMAVSGYNLVIPLSQVIQTVSRVSKTMPSCNKCTGKGGLAITETAINLKNKLKELSITGSLKNADLSIDVKRD
ncbi:serine dehydratase [Maribellus comscasis]|uniref:L-serine ammonia-lyase n=1 Tax=Maribellus comscasis TaxID=2681766 RepID=A0A6I6JW16_9BACT|nr:L-serine ammonia-lyase, iron-sulfur-dependent, subunit alpha [Maribellus comscasis]QGY46801.1 serine dehydratase [Maribellus comscasis]